MTERIPPDFDRLWPDSDVILLTDNAEGKKLYANRTVLSMFSPVLRAMFSHGFKEANQDSVEIHVDYEAMKEILRIIFHVDDNVLLNGPKQYDGVFLVHLYKAADFFDFALIRKMCMKQMLDRPSVHMALTVMNLDLHDILMDILEKLDANDVRDFFTYSNSRPFFSKKDFIFVYKKISGRELPEYSSLPLNGVLILEEVAPGIEKPIIDLTKKWYASDLAILTWNSAGRVLYSNKGALASASEHFFNLFFNAKMQPKETTNFEVDSEERDVPIIPVDVEYATMKAILSIIHHCNPAIYSPECFTPYHPVLLYDMYRVAAKLNIPCISAFCTCNQLEQFNGHNLDVAVKMNLKHIQSRIFKEMKWYALLDWIRSDEKSLVYRNCGEEVVLSTKQTEPVLSLKSLRQIYNKLSKHLMKEKIPPHFDTAWYLADVVLLTDNAGDKKLYVNKAVLSLFSPVMRAMFCHGFKEANQDSVEIHVDYEAMKEILRIIFQVDGGALLKKPKNYSTNLLLEIYKAADMYDFAQIRKFCIKQMLDRPSVEMALIAIDIDLHDVLKLPEHALTKFLDQAHSRPFFSKKDVSIIYNMHRGYVLPTKYFPTTRSVLNLEEVATEIENPRIDLAKKWLASDVALLTKNSAERVLYANKGTLASVSDHFHDLFFNENMLPKENADFEVNNEGTGTSVIHLDVEYATMKTILSIIHHCDTNYRHQPFTMYHPALLYDMSRVVDVAFKLMLINTQKDLIERMECNELIAWIHCDENNLVYRNDGMDVAISSKQTDLILSLSDLHNVICALKTW